MTTRPLRHADDREAELGNLRDWRDRMAADLEWVDAVLAGMESREEVMDPTYPQPNSSAPAR